MVVLIAVQYTYM